MTEKPPPPPPTLAPDVIVMTAHPLSLNTGYGMQGVRYMMLLDRVFRTKNPHKPPPRIIFWICNRHYTAQAHNTAPWWTPLSFPRFINMLRAEVSADHPRGLNQPLAGSALNIIVELTQVLYPGNPACNPVIREFLLSRTEVVLGPPVGIVGSQGISVHDIATLSTRLHVTDFFFYRELQLMHRLMFDDDGNTLFSDIHLPGTIRSPMRTHAPHTRMYFLYPSHTMAHDREIHLRTLTTLFDRIGFLTPFAHKVFRDSMHFSRIDVSYTMLPRIASEIRPKNDAEATRRANLCTESLANAQHMLSDGVCSVVPHVVEYALTDLFWRFPEPHRPHMNQSDIRKLVHPPLSAQSASHVWVMFNMGNYEVTNRKGFDLAAMVMFMVYDVWSRLLGLDEQYPMYFVMRSNSDPGNDNVCGVQESRAMDWMYILNQHLPFCSRMFYDANTLVYRNMQLVASAQKLLAPPSTRERSISSPASHHQAQPSSSVREPYVTQTLASILAEGARMAASAKNTASPLSDMRRLDRQAANSMRCASRLLRVEHIVSPREIRNLYLASDVLVHTSRMEGFGLPIVEAQTLGCPVVAPGDYNPELVFLGRTTHASNFVYNKGMNEMWGFPDLQETVLHTLQMCMARVRARIQNSSPPTSVLHHLTTKTTGGLVNPRLRTDVLPVWLPHLSGIGPVTDTHALHLVRHVFSSGRVETQCLYPMVAK